MNSSSASNPPPLVSVVVVNYNCKKWLNNFFASLRAQTVFDRVEVILVDNTSTDDSAEICEREMAAWPNGVFLPTGGNYGFGGGGNRGANVARGRHLLFLNPDVWLEKNCLEELVARVETTGARVVCPLVLDYDSDATQSRGASGFDLFGGPVPTRPDENADQLFSVATFFFIDRELFQRLGGFDEEFFLYSEETDLSWRSWIAGERVTLALAARVHHQAASAGKRTVENRTNETRRFYSNRNQLLTILKNAQWLLLALALSQLALIALEAIVGAFFARRLSFVRWALFRPVRDCWRLRRHIFEQREKIGALRQRCDWWLLRRFFRFGFGRWADVKRLVKFGVKIDKAWSTAVK